MSFGPAPRAYATGVGVAVLGLLLLSAALLARVALRRSEERARALGLLLMLGAMLALFLSVGRARAVFGAEYVTQGHYMNMAVPALCLVYLVCVRYGGALLRWLVPLGLCVAAGLLFPFNLKIGMGAAIYMSREQVFHKDVQARMPPLILSERHLGFLDPSADDADTLRPFLQAMHRAGVPQFKAMRPDPPYQEIAVATPPKGTPAGGAKAVRIDYALGAPRFVYAIRVQGSYGAAEPQRRALFRVGWESGCAGEQRRGAPVELDVRSEDLWSRFRGRVDKKMVTFWVEDVISGFSLFPDERPSEFNPAKITLYAPPEGAAPSCASLAP